MGREHPARARILSICDAYDAMVTDRVYRKGRSPEEAFGSARRFAGKQFDPRLVERFVSVVTRLGPDDAAGAFPSEAAEAVDRVREQVERMAGAGGAQDMSMLSAMASRLAATAGRDGLGEVAQVATGRWSGALAPPGRAGRREQGERADGTGEIRRAWHQRPRPAAP